MLHQRLPVHLQIFLTTVPIKLLRQIYLSIRSHILQAAGKTSGRSQIIHALMALMIIAAGNALAPLFAHV